MKSDRLRSTFYSFLSILPNFRQGAFLHIVSIFTVWICFFVLGIWLHTFVNIRSVLNLSEMRTHVSAYLKDEMSNSELNDFKQDYCTKNFIADCQYMSAAQAKEKFLQKNEDMKDTLGVLDENPLPPSVEIEFKGDFKDIEALKNFSKDLQHSSKVLHVNDGGEWALNWLRVLNLFDGLTYLLGIAFTLAVGFMISNTIRLLVYARKDEIEILSLVGATRGMIRLPFLVEGMLHGLIGCILSLITLKLVSIWVARYLHSVWPGFLPDHLVFLPWTVQVFLVTLAVGIGLWGSFFAVGKFFK